MGFSKARDGVGLPTASLQSYTAPSILNNMAATQKLILTRSRFAMQHTAATTIKLATQPRWSRESKVCHCRRLGEVVIRGTTALQLAVPSLAGRDR